MGDAIIAATNAAEKVDSAGEGCGSDGLHRLPKRRAQEPSEKTVKLGGSADRRPQLDGRCEDVEDRGMLVHAARDHGREKKRAAPEKRDDLTGEVKRAMLAG